MTDVDLLIEGGTIVDGTGAPGYRGTVAVVDDRLLVLPDGASGLERGDGAPAVRARRRIDARGLVVAPGLHRPAQPWRPGDARRAASTSPRFARA